jgi:hypothetical protein
MKKACQVTVQKQVAGDGKSILPTGNPPLSAPEKK